LRQRLIADAAEELFREQGFEATSMDEIARRAEYSKTTIYKYFKSKDELALLVYQKLHTQKMTVVKEAMARHENALAKLRAFGEAYFQFFAEHPDYLRFQLYWDYRGLHRPDIRPELMAKTETFIADDVDFFADLLRKGTADGSLRDNLEVVKILDLLYLSLRAVMNQVLLIDRKNQLGSFIEAGYEDYTRFLEHFLLSLQPHAEPPANSDTDFPGRTS